jgi:hypothetical protein
MYSEQLVMLLLIAATQLSGGAPAGTQPMTQPMTQIPRNGVENVRLQLKTDVRLSNAGKQRNRLKHDRAGLMVAEVR